MNVDDNLTDTIAAIATPYGKGGIGIIKISGPDALAILTKIFRGKGAAGKPSKTTASCPSFFSHQLKYGVICDPAKDDQIIDEVLASFMQKPHSYTCEDVVEINSHSGPAVLNEIMALIIKNGARCAQPGEFTKRAFLNGRYDLTQAEAIIDLINAKNSAARALASRMLRGGVRDVIEKIENQLIQILAELEILIDFPDDAPSDIDIETNLNATLQPVSQMIHQLIRNHQTYHWLRQGFHIGVIGQPNVGKSSLMNQLCGHERAIVSAYPGTTRDIVNAEIMLEGLGINIYDTAGIQPSDDPIEKIGINKSLETIIQSDLILFVTDIRESMDQNDRNILDIIGKKPKMIVYNKIDLYPPDELHGFTEGKPGWFISALTGEGISQLKRDLAQALLQSRTIANEPDPIAPNLRQKQIFEKVLEIIHEIETENQQQAPYEILAFHLRQCLDQLNLITGKGIGDKVIDYVFENYCIGK